MSLEVKIHEAQTSILRALLFLPSASFGDLRKPTGMTSDYFNFHITRLVELGLVEKVSRGTYRLTSRGKEYANRLDTDNNTIERQPKSAVIIGLTREYGDETQYLFQQRLKNPYYGFWGLPSGKIRWGELVAEAAARESLEETGLHADFATKSVYHERVVEKESELIIEDKIFFIVEGVNVQGDLVEEFEGGRNQWRTLESVQNETKKYATVDKEVELLSGGDWFFEQTVLYSKQEF